ncbi:magnetosome-associated protein MamJ isoform X2 [Oryzias melastigma]|uniref:magnetosome-associated protein MamJ isoform X2 n=1 Tax=Oryzias melastigma TaxID=30732 RepID=UPI00168CEDBA|nr:magnetosome-associated protein MamJ isoform X2 [Oryzias melastigma]
MERLRNRSLCPLDVAGRPSDRAPSSLLSHSPRPHPPSRACYRFATKVPTARTEMPSKRKKNKRRMRRVQVQRRELEEQHATNLPIKSSTGMVVAAPPATTPKKAPKSAALPPEQIPLIIPVTAPTKVEPKPVEIQPVEKLLSEDNRSPDPDVGLVEHISAGAEDHVDVELEAPTFAPEAAPAPEPLPADETDFVHKAELVLETEPATEIQPEGKAEPEPTHPVFDLESEVKAENQPEEDSAAAEEDVSAPTPVQEAAAEPVEPELPSDQVSVEVEPAADDLVPEPAAGCDAEAAAEISDRSAEEVAPREQEEQEEHAAAIPAAPLSPEQDSLVEIEEIPVVLEKTSEGEETPETENEKAADGLLSSDVVDTETNLTVEAVAFQQETLTDGDTSGGQTESVVLADLDPSENPAPSDSAAEQKHAAAQSDNPKAESCDLPCQMQLPVESVPLSTEEISVETALNGHIVPEVSIEG